MFRDYGVGVGIRSPHMSVFKQNPPPIVKWGEVISENYMKTGNGTQGHALRNLLKVREHIPIALHGVSMSLGSVDPLNLVYLRRLNELIVEVEPILVSDHICWTGIDGYNHHDLYPLPYSREALEHLVNRIQKVQDVLGRRLVVENVSSYVTFRSSEMTEWEFVRELAERSGCGLLLDVNNVYVSSVNHGFDPVEYLKSIPKAHVAQMHMAGHKNKEGFLIDTHDQPVSEPVWQLYRLANRMFPNTSVMIERDDNIPEWAELESELSRLSQIKKETSDETQRSAVSL